MNDERVNELSERQKQCLRLYYANLEVKEIGAKLLLSPNTVKKYLRDARRTLGASRSMQAARFLVGYEQDTQGIPPPSRLVSESEIADQDVAPEQMRPVARNRYNLTILQRIGLIVAIAFVAVALGGALLVGADAITRIFVGYGIDISDKPYRK
jgi:DNA-binding CsgD family transcriptional regulator